jgi:hypothetical protein
MDLLLKKLPIDKFGWSSAVIAGAALVSSLIWDLGSISPLIIPSAFLTNVIVGSLHDSVNVSLWFAIFYALTFFLWAGTIYLLLRLVNAAVAREDR